MPTLLPPSFWNKKHPGPRNSQEDPPPPDSDIPNKNPNSGKYGRKTGLDDDKCDENGQCSSGPTIIVVEPDGNGDCDENGQCSLGQFP